MAYFYLAALAEPELIHQARRFGDKASHREQLHVEASYALYEADTSQAVAILESLVDQYPYEAYALWRLGRIHELSRQWETAVRFYRLAIVADPLYRDAYNNLAYLYDFMGEWEESILAINRYIDISPNEANPYDTRGDIYVNQGEYEKAIQSYRKALEIKPDYYVSLLNLGLQYLYEQEFHAADSCLNVVIENAGAPRRSAARHLQAASLVQRGKLHQAMESLKAKKTSDSLDGQNVDAVRTLLAESRVNAAIGEYDLAIEKAGDLLNQAEPRSDGEAIYFHMFYVHALAEAGELESARAALATLRNLPIDMEYKVTASSFAEGVLEFHQGNSQLAEPLFESAFVQSSEFHVLFMLARA
jgi:tetratricopeptide (TPR) repeat protein